MDTFTKEELQFIKKHLNYPIDRDDTPLYYHLMKKIKDLLKIEQSKIKEMD